jgi:hypothetical protein
MDLKRGVTFPTLDPQWVVKVLIGTLISFVPILNFVAIGYAMDTSRNVYHGRETPLPEWNDFGGQFIRGLLGAVIQFVWSIPLLLLTCPFIFTIISSIDPETGALNAAGGVAFVCLPLLIVLGALVLAPFIMTALTRYAVTNQFSEAMPGPVLREVRSSIRPWLVILAASIGIGIVAALLQVCTLGFGAILFVPLAFYMQLVMAHWYAQAHRAATGGVSTPPTMV